MRPRPVGSSLQGGLCGPSGTNAPDATSRCRSSRCGRSVGCDYKTRAPRGLRLDDLLRIMLSVVVESSLGGTTRMENHGLCEVVQDIPPGVARRRWTLRADNHGHHHNRVRLSECPLYLELRWPTNRSFDSMHFVDARMRPANRETLAFDITGPAWEHRMMTRRSKNQSSSPAQHQLPDSPPGKGPL